VTVLSQFEHLGFPCVAVQEVSYICGYVGVPLGHPLHGEAEWYKFDLSANGDLSFTGHMKKGYTKFPDDTWWFGFDTNHSWDDSHTKEQTFVEAVCRQLAAKIKEAVS